LLPAPIGSTGSLVVVAGQIHHLGAVLGARQQPMQDMLMRVRPEPSLAQAPAVDDVADQIQVVGLDVLQEIQQTISLATSSTEV
jgi:hypothetical protein